MCAIPREDGNAQVLIGSNVRVEPYAVVQAGAALEAGAALGALRKAKSGCVREKKDPLALLRAIGRGQKPSEDALAALKKCGLFPSACCSIQVANVSGGGC